MSVLRAYLINAETGEEMKDHPLNGKYWLGSSGNKFVDGRFIRGTSSVITVADYSDLYTIKNEQRITPDLFDHPVVVKVWAPKSQDWRYLVSDEHTMTDLDYARARRCHERST